MFRTQVLSLLLALPVRIRFRLVHHDPVIEVGHPRRQIGHHARDPGHPVVINVLWLVGHLVIIRVAAGGEEDDRYTVAGRTR